MKLPALLVTDTHFVDEPACEYRWGLWPWLRDRVREHKVRTLVHTGDLVDRKDNHPSSLVNRLADEVKKTRDLTGCAQIYMAGNHDWLKEGQEFFRFLRHMDGVQYVSEPWEDEEVKGASAMFLPYSKDPVGDWRAFHSFEHYDLLFMHQTVGGSVTSNGEKLPGEALPRLNARKVYSGDIHVPQVVRGPFGEVEYVGSPYHVHFGDDFVPRCVLLDKDMRPRDLTVPGMPRRVVVRASSMRQLMSRVIDAGDQVKLRLELRPEDRHDWARMRREATAWLRSRGAVVHAAELVAVGDDGRRVSNARAERMAGASPEVALERYVRDEELGGDAYEEGMRLL